MRALIERLELKEKMIRIGERTPGGGRDVFVPDEYFITLTIPTGEMHTLSDDFEWKKLHSECKKISKSMGGEFISDIEKANAIEVVCSVKSKKEGQKDELFKKFVRQFKGTKEYKLLAPLKPKFSIV